jgi:hypothetical protein
METAEEIIFKDIEYCRICKDHKPFHFEMGRQKIMLISFAPTYYTLQRPIYFIQYFRKICLALFGDITPSEDFIREFYDPAGNIYWTHYQKCFKRDINVGASRCEPLLITEVKTLDPEIIIILEHETVSYLCGQGNNCGSHQNLPLYIRAKKDGTPRQIFCTDLPARENVEYFQEIRKALKPYISWIKVECGDLDFSGANFIDLEYASLECLSEASGSTLITANINNFEHEWINGVIMPNIKAYNMLLQVFTFIESNIKNLLGSQLSSDANIETRWFTPFEKIVNDKLQEDAFGSRIQKQSIHALMENIDSLHALRNVISHGSGVIDDRDKNKNLKNFKKIRRLKGVFIYGGNSVFISQEGVGYILEICDNFRRIYKEYFIHQFEA